MQHEQKKIAFCHKKKKKELGARHASGKKKINRIFSRDLTKIVEPLFSGLRVFIEK